MAIVDWEGFDRETANVGIFHSSGSVSNNGDGAFGYGRRAGGVFSRITAFAPVDDIFVNLHWYNIGGHNLWKLAKGTNIVGRFYANGAVFSYALGNVGTTVVQANYFAPAEKWYFLQMRLKPHPTNGYVEMRINGVPLFTFSGNTTGTGDTSIDGWEISSYYTDNLLLYSPYGDPPITWTPETRIWDELPNGAGGTTEWTPSSGTNWQCNDEQPSNGDADYVSATTAPLTDTYAAPGPASPGSLIYAVGVHCTARKDDAGTNELDGVLRVGSTNYARGAPAPITASYARYRWLWHQNPATAAAWTVSEANACQPGVRRTT